MKKLFVLACLFFATIESFSQTVNYALENADGKGSVQVLTIRELNDSPQATFQMWLKPMEWTAAKLLSQDNFSIELGEKNSIVLKSGDQSAIITASNLMNKWSQVTITVTDGTVKAYINNNEVVVDGSVSTVIPSSTGKMNETTCIIAQGFKGQIDEIRIWNRALEQKDFFWRNTLNKYNPNYDFLVAYWKCDQNLCENLVDYKFVHHGVMDKITRVAVTDNNNFKYRIVTGYTNLQRFTDRPNINRDMFLMTNDVILLSAKVQNDGSLLPEYPDNSAVPTNVDYVGEFQGRQGVMNFKGNRSQLLATNNRAFHDPNAAFGYGDAEAVSFSAWVYIDQWSEGAELVSNYQDDNNCIVVKLGKEADKEIVVNFFGTVGTLKNRVEVGKWHYIGVYLKPARGKITNTRFNPIKIGIDYVLYDRRSESGVEISGNDMDLTLIPFLANSKLKLGKNLNGYMDEVMIWGSDRSGSAKSDSENGFQWNAGNWGNIFLTAYWRGDNPDNIGKDSQSYLSMIEFIRNYYKNYRGYKIRLGIIYPNGDKWSNILNKKENADRLIRDAKVLLEHCDGLDVDLEWKYYGVFNPVVRRLIDEVMPPASRGDKVFSVSQHQYSYELDKNLIPDVDYFTMQLYGPSTNTYTWDYYVNAHKTFLNYGYPNDKLLLSYGILLVNGSEQGYKDLFEKFGMNDENYNPNLNIWNGWYFNGVNQTKRKQDYILENDCLGTMYFDMGNDLKVSDYKSLIRAQNEIIASNVDTLVTQVNMGSSSIEQASAKTKGEKLFSFYPNPANDRIVVSLAHDREKAVCEICTLDGKLVMQPELYLMNNTLSLTGLNAGFYLIKVHQGGKEYATKLCIN